MLTRKSVFFATLAAASLLALPLSAEGKPDFSGSWKLNMSESKAEEDGPKSLAFKIEHKEPALKYTAKGEDFQGDPFTETAEFTIDGKEYPGPEPTKLTAHWEDQVLVIRATLGGATLQTVRMRLSADRRQMVRDISAKDQIGERSIHQVFDRE
jgi:hypothetical protein